MIIKFNKQKRNIVIFVVSAILVMLAVGIFANTYSEKLSSIDTNAYNDSSIKNNSEKDNMKEVYDFNLKWDKTMAEVFNIDLNNYRKINTLVGYMKPEYKDLNMGDIREQIHLNYGDTVLSVYINEDNTQGIAATQDLKGLYTLYEFAVNNDSTFKWKITDTKTAQGERKYINEAEKDYFTKNPTPNSGDTKQPPLQNPISQYETTVQAKP